MSGDLRLFDEKNSQKFATQCEVILLIGKGNSHFLSLFFYTDKKYKNDIMNTMKEYLDKTLVFPTDGATNFGTGNIKLAYNDVENQSLEFRDTLKYLLKYGILSPRPAFDGEAPLTWDAYIRLHVWAVYHKKLNDRIDPQDAKSPTFETIIRKLPVNRGAYVDSSKRDYFELMLTMALAGVELPNYSESTLNQFRLHAATKYRDEWQKIEDFEYLYFRGQKMGPNGFSYYNTGSYASDFATYYNPMTGLSREPVIGQDPIHFGDTSVSLEEQKIIDAELACTKNASRYFSAECFQKRQEYIWSLMSYSVLTK